MDLVSLQDVSDAARRLEGIAWRTPVLECDPLPGLPGVRILVKAENLQNTGSFKVRGAANALLARRERGSDVRRVVTYSAGNHGAGAAFAGSKLGVKMTVCMPTWAVLEKIETVRRFGGEVVLSDDFLAATHSLAAELGADLLHPFDDHDVIAGQGTLGLEVLEQTPDPDIVIIPVGGGGLISGLGTVLSGLAPRTRIVGVEPIAADSMANALKAGAPVSLPLPVRSVADGLTAPAAGVITFEHVRRFVHEMVQVDEEEIRRAWRLMVSSVRLFVEPSAATTLAALSCGRVEPPEGSTVLLIATGGNGSVAALASLRRNGPPGG